MALDHFAKVGLVTFRNRSGNAPAYHASIIGVGLKTVLYIFDIDMNCIRVAERLNWTLVSVTAYSGRSDLMLNLDQVALRLNLFGIPKKDHLTIN